MLFFLATVGALIGGLEPALAAAAVSGMLLNYFFTPPTYSLTIAEPTNLVTVLAMVLVALMVALVVDRAARRAVQATRARTETTLLASYARTVLTGADPAGADEPQIATDAFTVDLAARKVHRAGVEVHLTPTEWGILGLLVRHPGRLVTQRQLLSEVWGPAYLKESHYLRVYLAQLRRKLEPDPSWPRHFVTEPGMGYRFEP